MFRICSAMMCWDAAIECQIKAGVQSPGNVSTDSHDNVISLDDDNAVTNKHEMQRVPQGASMGFFRDRTLVHFMIAVGAGCAAGNKNHCIGIGNPVGWEILNLAEKLTWGRGGFIDPGDRLFLIRYRKIE